jgi:hypothetical protein
MRALILGVTVTLLALSAGAQQPPAPPAKVSAAILDLEAKGLSETEAGSLSDRLRSELFYTGAFDVMERGKMQDILKEQGFQQSGACNTNACAVEVGQLIGVQKMIAGSLGKVGKTYSVILRMVDVRTGRVEQSVTEDYTGEIDKLLTVVMKSIANKMAAATRSDHKLAQGALPQPAAQGKPLYKKWWFWGGIGALGAGGAAAALLGGGGTTTEPIPTVESLPLPPDPPMAPGFTGGGER